MGASGIKKTVSSGQVYALETIKSYPTQFEAQHAKIALDGAGIPSVIVGVGVAMQGGMAGVQLMVPADRVEQALRVLEDE